MMNNLNFQFSHKKLMSLNLPGEEIVGRYNCTLTRKYNLSHKDNHFTEGITMTSRKLKMFYPHIIDSEDPGANYYIYISMYPKVFPDFFHFKIEYALIIVFSPNCFTQSKSTSRNLTFHEFINQSDCFVEIVLRRNELIRKIFVHLIVCCRFSKQSDWLNYL